MKLNKVKVQEVARQYAPAIVTGALVFGGIAGADDTQTSGIDFTKISSGGVAIIAAAGAAGAALLVAGNGLKIAVKWAKRMVGMA